MTREDVLWRALETTARDRNACCHCRFRDGTLIRECHFHRSWRERLEQQLVRVEIACREYRERVERIAKVVEGK